MRQLFTPIKISHKLTLGFLGLILLPLLVLIVYNLHTYSQQSAQQLTESGRYVLGTLETDVNEQLDSVETIIQSLATNGNLVSFLSRSFYGAPSFEEYSQAVAPLLRGAESSVEPFLHRLWILTENTTIPRGYGLVFPLSALDLPELQTFRDSGKEEAWYFSPRGLVPNSLESYEKQIFTYIKAISSPFGKVVGYAVAEVQASTLFSQLIYSREERAAFYLMDRQYHSYLSNVTMAEGFQFPLPQESKESNTVYLTAPIPRLSLLLGLSLHQPGNNVLLQNSFLTIAIISLLALLFLLLFFAMLRSITSRLRRYAQDMEEIAASGFRHALETGPPDEIGEIGAQFNITLQKVHSLLQENIQKETAYKDVQLQALLLQINPHFIYNTLDLFVGKLTLGGQHDIADYMCDFANLLRYNTRTTKMFLPLGEELAQGENYVSLQRCRFGDSVVLRKRVSPTLYSLPVMRFLLQPLVENAFEHGMAGKGPTEPRLLGIHAQQRGDWLVLRVKDNGAGMDKNRLAALNQLLREPGPISSLSFDQKRKGIGLENIRDRLRLFYSGNALLQLRSREGLSTRVFIAIKVSQAEEEAKCIY